MNIRHNYALNVVRKQREEVFLGCFLTPVFSGVVIICIAILSGCMYMPAARDDLSVLGNDVFSNLIRESYSDKNTSDKATGVGGHLGPSRIDRKKANKIAQSRMRGLSVQKVTDLFTQEGGQCSSLVLEPERVLKCNIVRKWKLKNIGAPIDTSYWSNPAAKLNFKFLVSDLDVVTNVHLSITDITVHKPDYRR